MDIQKVLKAALGHFPPPHTGYLAACGKCLGCEKVTPNPCVEYCSTCVRKMLLEALSEKDVTDLGEG